MQYNKQLLEQTMVLKTKNKTYFFSQNKKLAVFIFNDKLISFPYCWQTLPRTCYPMSVKNKEII